MITDKSASSEEWTPTVCYMCQNACSILVKKEDGVVVKIEGNPESPHNEGKICGKGQAGLMGLYDPNRVLKPLKRTNAQKGIGVDAGWVEISWEEALRTIGERLRKVRATDPRGLLFSLFDVQNFGAIGPAFMTAFGTPNLNLGASYNFCGNNVHNIFFHVHGAFFAEPDFDYANYCLHIGSQNGIGVGTNPMGLAKRLADARDRRGMKLVVVDPVCSPAASKADEWVPIRPGTDGALCMGIANILVNSLGLYDKDFLMRYTNAPYLIDSDGYYVRDPVSNKPMIWDRADDRAKAHDDQSLKEPALKGVYQASSSSCTPAFELLCRQLEKFPVDFVSEVTSVPRDTIKRVAKEFGTAANIGAKITIDGVELPYRPVCVDWNRGPAAHKHCIPAGWAIQLLNTLVGAIDVPGGKLGVNVVDPLGNWTPTACPDGMMVPGMPYSRGGTAYPPNTPTRPQTLGLKELFPLQCYTAAWPLVLVDPEKFKLPYKIEMLIHARENLLKNMGDPKLMESALRRIPFMVSFTQFLDETAEFADIVLPDAHYLESLTPFPNLYVEFQLAGEGYWYQSLRQPVVEPPPGVRPWMETLVALAYSAGITREFNKSVSAFLQLKEEHMLRDDVEYSYSEIIDRWSKSLFGQERGLEWFKKNGVIKVRKDVRAAYPRPFIKGRVPIYLEHYKKLGEQVRAITAEMGLDWWDVSDYLPLPDWIPCPTFESKKLDYDTFVVNHKVQYHTHAYTYTNPWLAELSDHYPNGRAIVIHPRKAREKNIADGDEIWLESIEGRRIKGTARLSEGVHPEVAATVNSQGQWSKGQPTAKNRGYNYNVLVNYDLDRFDFGSTAIDSCIKVKITKA